MPAIRQSCIKLERTPDGKCTWTTEVVMPKHKNKAVQTDPDSSRPALSKYLFPITIGVLLAAVAGIGWFLFSPATSNGQRARRRPGPGKATTAGGEPASDDGR